MAKFGGFPGMGGGNMNNLLKQAQKMQADMMNAKQEIEEKEFEVTSGGGAITITMTGGKLLKGIKIKQEIVDPNDIEMLEDLILVAINEGIKKADELVEAEMRRFNVPSGLI